MKYLVKLTKCIREKENLPTIREVMTTDEIMQYLVNYGIYGKNYSRVVTEMKVNEDSEFLDDIVRKISVEKDSLERTECDNEPTLVTSNFMLPEDIKLAMKQYDYMPIDSVARKSTDFKLFQDQVLSSIDSVNDFGVRTREIHEKITDHTFQQTNIPEINHKLSTEISTIVSLCSNI